MGQSKAGIIYNDSKPSALRAKDSMVEWLETKGWKVHTATGTSGILGYSQPHSPVRHSPIDRLAPPGFDTDMDFAIVLGGDGTVLAAARQLAPHRIPLLAVNTGHLGFLTETYLPLLFKATEAVLSGDCYLDERTMIAVQVWREGALIWEALALNELVLHREPLTSMCHFEISIGEHSPLDVAADGIIVATPTGSTAYALSAGGPVVIPGVSVLQLIPICAHSLASRALVFPDSELIQIVSPQQDQLILVVDGNAGCYISPHRDEIRIARSSYQTQLIRLKRAEFFRLLREKLGWGLTHASKPTSVELP
ncbi:NAD(+) kinase [Synechococcus sp. PCC 7336]|uniref:NAD(+) kinase n=1 Tax=Synechococcus sp. PCC 7336 TaxID=195250 RepID=UPI00047564FF|nr:NAD(+) kinase [Synechococcus sp. PCC 7336]